MAQIYFRDDFIFAGRHARSIKATFTYIACIECQIFDREGIFNTDISSERKLRPDHGRLNYAQKHIAVFFGASAITIRDFSRILYAKYGDLILSTFSTLEQRAPQMVKGAAWSQEEDEILKHGWPDMKAIQQLLPHRGIGSIYVRCNALGLQRWHKIKWATADDEFLRSNIGKMTRGELAVRFNTNVDVISARVHKLGLSFYKSHKNGVSEPV